MAATVSVMHRPGAGPTATVVRVTGQMDDVGSSKSVHEHLAPVITAQPRVVVLDLGELTFLNSTGIGVLVDFRQRLTKAGSTVYVTNMQPQISKVMDIVQVLPKQSVFKTMKEMDDYLAEIQRRVTSGE